MRSVLERLKRRKLGQWSIGYLAAAFIAVQVMDGVSGPLEMSLATQQRVLFLLVMGFFLTLVLAWYHGGWAMLESFHVSLDVPAERLETATRHFERALALEPDFAPAVAGLSMVEGYYVFQGVDTSRERRQRSLELARRALEIEPDATGPYFNVADIHREREDWEAALAVYERASERFVTTGLLLRIGMVSAAAGEIERAADALEEAFERGGLVSSIEASPLADEVLGNERLRALLDRYR